MGLSDTEFGGVLGVMETLVLVGPQMRMASWQGLRQAAQAPAAGWIGAGIVALTLSNLLHTMAFFAVLKSSGPIFSALLKAVQTLCVFVLSQLLFCSRDRPAQPSAPLLASKRDAEHRAAMAHQLRLETSSIRVP